MIDKIIKLKVEELTPYVGNAKQHPQSQIDAIKKSIEKFGFNDPIAVWGEDNIIVEGHGRLAAAEQLGIDEVPCIRLDHMSEEERRAYTIAHNSTSLNSGFDLEKLNTELASIDLDMAMFGLEEQLKEIEREFAPEVIEDEVPEVSDGKAVTELGDIWQLGRHRLMCGDSTKEEDVAKLMNGNKADMVFTDPPYNVDYSNIDRPKPSKHDLGKIKNDIMGEEDFYNFLVSIYKRLDEATKEDSSFYIWYADKSTIPFYKALQETNIKFNQMLIWKKPLLLGRNRYQYAHEPCIFGVKGSPYFTDDRTKTTVWDFGGYDKSKNVHPTQKPLFLPSEAIQNSSLENEIVLDVFGGSGSTLIACEQLNRSCYMMELDPKYVQVIIQRYIAFKGTSDDVYRINADGTKTKYEDIF